MTTTTVSRKAARPWLLADATAVLRRTHAEGQRDPGPALLLPALPSILMTVAFTSQFDRLSEVLALPTGSFDEFIVPGLVIAVALASAGFTAGGLARDIATGFMDRLRLYPAGTTPLLLGRLAYEGLRVLPGAAVVLAVGVLMGGTVANGPAGLAVVFALTMLTSAAFSGLHLIVGALTEDPQTPLNMQPVGVLIMFLSGALVPVDAFPEWAEVIARANPVTPIADGARAALIGDLTSTDTLIAFVVALGWLIASVVAASAVVRAKTERT
jgi:ABC-2 type transport system permease protein